jgi:hypothetical protein
MFPLVRAPLNLGHKGDSGWRYCLDSAKELA